MRGRQKPCIYVMLLVNICYLTTEPNRQAFSFLTLFNLQVNLQVNVLLARK
jgi:hypothetical protein